MPKISVFNGGLHTAAAAHLIADKESVINLNIDHISGMIKPLYDKTEAVLNAKQWGHFFTTDLSWYFDDDPKDWVEFQERLYIGNRTGFSTKIVGSNEWLMGIVGPTVIPTGVVSAETPDQDQITRCSLTAASVGGDIPDGELIKYRIVNINIAGDYYSADTEFSVRISSSAATNQVTLNCTDTNIQNQVAIFRFFDNYWRRIYLGAAPTGIIDNVFDISANPEWDAEVPGRLDGVYQYALTWFNTVDSTESVPVISEEITVNHGIITVSNLEIPISDPQVNLKRLYRIGGSNTAFTRVTDLPIGQTVYIDILADDELEGTLLDSEQNYPPVENMHWLMESYSMLFAADGDKLRFTPIGEANNWPQTYFLDFPRTITGLAKTPIGILVFNQYETWLVTGTGPLSLAQQLLTGSQGCINGDTVVNIEGAAYWVSTDGVCLSNGGQVQVVTNNALDKLDLSGSINAVVYDEQYHLLTDTTAWLVDLKRKVIKHAQYNIQSFIIANDTLYGYDNGVDATFEFTDGSTFEFTDGSTFEFTDGGTPVGILHELESSIDKLEMHYKSPEYIGIAFTIPKVYKNIYVFSEGQLTASVYIDKVLVQTSVLETAYGNHQFKIPDISSKGHSIQFEIIGTGTVYEIQWMDGNANK